MQYAAIKEYDCRICAAGEIVPAMREPGSVANEPTTLRCCRDPLRRIAAAWFGGKEQRYVQSPRWCPRLVEDSTPPAGGTRDPSLRHG